MDIDTHSVVGGNYYTLTLTTPVAQNSIEKPGAEIISGGEIAAQDGDAIITSEGYYDGIQYDKWDHIELTTTEAEGYYKLATEGIITINRSAIKKQVTASGFIIEDDEPVTKIEETSETETITGTDYFIKKSVLDTRTVVSTDEIQEIEIGEGYYPAPRIITVNPVPAVMPTTSVTATDMTRYFYSANQSDYDISIIPKFSCSGGYVPNVTDINNGDKEYYKIKTTEVVGEKTTTDGISITRGSATWNAGWIDSGSISPAVFSNSATAGKTYVDISNTTEAPVLTSGDYLYINAGYVDDLKISLAKIVPNNSSALLSSDHILNGYSVYNNDGVLVTGNIQTYDGSYTLT